MSKEKDFREAKVRQLILNAVKEDLIGPSSIEEELSEIPTSTYITGMLFPADAIITEDENYRDVEFSDRFSDSEQDADHNIEGTVFEDDEADDHGKSLFQKPSSAGLSFYVKKDVGRLYADISWGHYYADEVQDEIIDGTLEEDAENKKKKARKVYRREQMDETVEIDLSLIGRSGVVPLDENPMISLYIIQMELKNDYNMISIYLHNNDKAGNGDKEYEKVMFQVKMSISDGQHSPIFLQEYQCRDTGLEDEYYYKSRPVFARGRGCSAMWDCFSEDENAHTVSIAFIPDYEIHGVSAVIEELPKHLLSVLAMSKASSRADNVNNLRQLLAVYKDWVEKTLIADESMNDPKFKEKGQKIIDKCIHSFKRIGEGIEIIESDDVAYQAFVFMNKTMFMQKALSEYAAKNGSGIPCKLREFMDESSKPDDKRFDWRPFQIAFVLLNIKGIINGFDPERDLVDLLYFPTGGGKTEAYLGLIAFTIGYRRLTIGTENEYNKDGGVTVFLRYTLRLLTTQQRDRLLRLVVAMEMTRDQEEREAIKKELPIAPFGHERISIGFWVGGTVTPNKFDEMGPEPWKDKDFRRKITKQIIKCPCCGKEMTNDSFKIIPEMKSVEIHCPNRGCYFSEAGVTMPVYLVDEEIYAKCPTIIISTVEKFARLPWSEQVGLMFGKTDRYCTRCGHIAVGEKHTKHRAAAGIQACSETDCKLFYTPELIIQDELHLITGPLGTIYGGYETVVEEMCAFERDGKKIKPKYIVSTATIRNAEEQVRSLYAREECVQFPPSGFDISDSFFIREVPLPSYDVLEADNDKANEMIRIGEKPFRQYIGVCAAGQSVKTTLVRLYSAILQKTFELSSMVEYSDFVDPYYTLIGYFNSIRELGGAVRLLDDDIVSRIHVLMKKHKRDKQRFLNRTKEITSRVPSWQIAQVLEELMQSYDKEKGNKQDCYDVVIATNMIAVGMDVSRLGLMTVVGQPKQNSEYIQATSRVGREHPGIIFTVYNPYRPRDLSNYENFVGFHSQMYRYVEGTTATPFAARARDRDLHALVVSLLRLNFENMADNAGARNILDLSDEEINSVKKTILDRVAIVANSAYGVSDEEMDNFISTWKDLAREELVYWTYNTKAKKRLLSYYGQYCAPTEMATLNSMRDVETASTLYHI
jgi:hypothetical protein